MAGKKIIVSLPAVNQRLDKFLSPQFPALSRSKLQALIKAGFVFVNQKKVPPHYFLKEKDIIEIKKLRDFLSPPFSAEGRIPRRGGKARLRYSSEGRLINSLVGGKKIISDFKIKIIAEANNYLVINKPAGILVHPTALSEGDTLTAWLLKKYPAIKKVYDHENKEGKNRPGIVHRLDKNVSGLMVIAKTQKMFDCLKEQFKNRQIKKEYLALVYGTINLDQGRIERPIGRSAKTGLMAARSDQTTNSKEAITEFEVVKRYKNYTLLKIKLLTGRTNQIRVHLKSIGHSIFGDYLYQTRDLRQKKKKLIPNFIFLYSALLGFSDLDHQWQEFKLPLPIKFKKFLAGLIY